MVVGSACATPVSAVAMLTLAMAGIYETLSRHTPLDSYVFRTIYRQAFIDTPAYGAMVDHYPFFIHASETVAFMSFIVGFQRLIAEPEPHETYYYVWSAYDERIISDADTVAGSSLSGDCHVSLFKSKFRFQMNSAGNVENYGSSSSLVASPTERTLATVIEVCNVYHLSASATSGNGSEPFSSGERGEQGIICRSRNDGDSSRSHRHH